MDRLKALEIFKTVADHRSFAKAADTLNLSAPAVSRSVRDLEALLGVRLMQRTTRRVSLTAEGQAVLERARTLLQTYDELAATSSLSAAEAAGDVRLTAPVSFGTAQLAPVLADFMTQHPRVRIELLLTDAPLDLVEHGIDLALRVTDTLPEGLIARRIGEARVGIYASPGYLRRHGVPRHPDELQQHACLLHAGSGRALPWRFRHPVTQQFVEPELRGALCANHAEALLAGARHGSGLAMLPQFLAEPAVARGELQPVLSAWSVPALGIHLAYCSRHSVPLRVRKLMDALALAFDGSDRTPVAGAPAVPRRLPALEPAPAGA